MEFRASADGPRCGRIFYPEPEPGVGNPPLDLEIFPGMEDQTWDVPSKQQKLLRCGDVGGIFGVPTC